MADEEAVKTENVAAEDSAPPKSKKEMRDIPHSYVDANHNNDWCAVCGRSEGWRIHTVKESPAAPPVKVQTPAIPTEDKAAPKKSKAPKA